MRRETGKLHYFAKHVTMHANVAFSRGFKGLKQAVKLEYKLGKYGRVRTRQ